ncbi:hypothetical protein ACS0TY_033104 [Phlomoides rotata]
MAAMMGLYTVTLKMTKVHKNLKQIFSAPSLFSPKSCSISTTASIFIHSRAQPDAEVPSTKHTESPFTGLEEVMAGYILGKKKATEVAHAVWKNVVRKGDLVIDTTCGNGYDTLAMLRLIADDTRRGRVYAMDLQKDALERTSSLLDSSLTSHERELVELYAMCHSKMEELVRSGDTVRLVAFNLGYLPGGDKKIKTESDTTLLALEAAKKILSRRGLISILAYVGHSGGR